MAFPYGKLPKNKYRWNEIIRKSAFYNKVIIDSVIDLGSKITAVVTAVMKLKDACSLEEKL